MKRTPLKRKTPLKAKTGLKRSGFKRKPPDPEKAAARKKALRIQQKDSEYSAYWRKRATDLWAKIVRERASGRCEFTGQRCDPGELEAHHIVTAGIYGCRTDLRNGMAIRAIEHKHSDYGPHGAKDWLFYDWLERERPEQYAYYQEHKSDTPGARINWKEEYDRLHAIKKEAHIHDADQTRLQDARLF